MHLASKENVGVCIVFSNKILNAWTSDGIIERRLYSVILNLVCNLKNKIIIKLSAIPAQTIIFGGNFLFSTTVFLFQGLLLSLSNVRYFLLFNAFKRLLFNSKINFNTLRSKI